jgi:polysaccharide pyruvyl transferase WcaK-like protein
MKLTSLLKTTNLEHSLLIGYYGGGNYGDELLLEVLGNLLKKQGVEDVTITYQGLDQYKKYHHDFGYKRIEISDKKTLVKHLLKNKRILIGGGGLWGVDMNLNTFLLSFMLFISRWFLGKKVYLLGVGYYNSTNRLGHAGAWLAAKSANVILGRDEETVENFSRLNKRTYLDTDIAWHVDSIDLESYESEVKELEQKLKVGDKTLFITLRRAQAKHKQEDFVHFTQKVEACIEANQDKSIIIGLLESKSKSPLEYEQAHDWQEQFDNVQVLDFPHNPLALFLFFRKHNKQLAVIGPQFHIIITAHLTDVPFMPVVYDNKVDALLSNLGITAENRIPIKGLVQADMQAFVNSYFGGSK